MNKKEEIALKRIRYYGDIIITETENNDLIFLKDYYKFVKNINKIYLHVYIYRVRKILKVIDGDTVDIVIDLGFNINMKIRIRLIGYDAPEIYEAITEKEKVAGIKCREYLKKLLEKYKNNLYVKTTKQTSTYSRYEGELLYMNGNEIISINKLMIQYINDNNFTKNLLRNFQ